MSMNATLLHPGPPHTSEGRVGVVAGSVVGGSVAGSVVGVTVVAGSVVGVIVVAGSVVDGLVAVFCLNTSV